MSQNNNHFKQFLDIYFDEKELQTSIKNFLKEAKGAKKWMLYSDYCLGDKGKVNDVMTFALVPFISEVHYESMQHTIAALQPKDIKHSSRINPEFLEYVKKQPVFICSYILDDRKAYFGSDHSHRVGNIKNTLQKVADCYNIWASTATNKDTAAYYQKASKTLSSKVHYLVSAKTPNISLFNDILITAFLGAYLSYKVLDDVEVETFGWFSDRDKVISGQDNIITPIFNYFLHNLWKGKKQYLMNTMTPDDSVPLFYEEFNRIPDIVSGAIADYKLGKEKAESEKSTSVLIGIIAKNPKLHIFRLFVKDNCFHVAKEVFRVGCGKILNKRNLCIVLSIIIASALLLSILHTCLR